MSTHQLTADSVPAMLTRRLTFFIPLTVTVLVACHLASGGVVQAEAATGACQPASSVSAIIDDSLSMGRSDPAAIRRRALELLITKPSAADLTLGGVEFGSYASTLFLPGPLASEGERAGMLASLAALQNDGSTEDDGGSTNYAAAFALSGLNQPEADARIFLTDGGHNEGTYDNDHRGGPPTYVVGLGIGPDGSSSAASLAARIAEETGGRYFSLYRNGRTKRELNQLQPTINRIDTLLDCQALRKQTKQTFSRRGQVGVPTETSFGSAGALEIVVSWSVSGCNMGLRSAVATDRHGAIVADLAGKRRIGHSKRHRAKLSVNTVAGKTFETITVQRPPKGRHLIVRLGAQHIVKPAVVRIQIRTVPPGTAPGDSEVTDEPQESSGAQPPPAPTPGPSTPPTPKPLRKVITVYNKVTNGPTQMREDSTPVRLTTKPWKFCTSRGCNINGTERMTGGQYDAAVCQTTGDLTTNGNNSDPSDDGNPNLYTSDRYYGVRLTDNTFGYVSWVWINAAHRGGLGLPAC